MKVNIYIESGSRSPRRQKRSNCYILETVTAKGTATATGFKDLEDTMHGASVKTLQAAAARLKHPVEVCVYTDDNYLAGMVRDIENLKNADFAKADGSSVAYEKEWRDIAESIIKAEASTQWHSYADWMHRELEARYERKKET